MVFGTRKEALTRSPGARRGVGQRLLVLAGRAACRRAWRRSGPRCGRPGARRSFRLTTSPSITTCGVMALSLSRNCCPVRIPIVLSPVVVELPMRFGMRAGAQSRSSMPSWLSGMVVKVLLAKASASPLR